MLEEEEDIPMNIKQWRAIEGAYPPYSFLSQRGLDPIKLQPV